MDRGFWWATVHWVTESDTTKVTKHAHTPNILILSQFYVLTILYFKQNTSPARIWTAGHHVHVAPLEMWVRHLGQEDPLDEGMATHSGFLPGESHGQRSLAGYGP